MIKKAEEAGNNFKRLALFEMMKSKPFGAVYDYYCMKNNAPVAQDYIAEIEKYEVGCFEEKINSFNSILSVSELAHFLKPLIHLTQRKSSNHQINQINKYHQNVIAVFDIGKTNKKIMLFDENVNVVFQEEQKFEEIVDDDGFCL